MLSGTNTLVVLFLALVGAALFSVASAGMGDGGSKCADASCTPAPPGSQCEPKYGERDDGCCPVWHCSNGQTTYGMSKSNGNSFSSFSSSSTSTGGGMPMMPMGNPFGGNSPFGGGNPFASLFSSMFGRR